MISNIYKFSWYLRALLYKFFFGCVGNKTYIGKPIFLYGSKNIFIKDKVRIFPNSRFECHRNGKILIDTDVSIGQNLHITSIGYIKIHSGTTISGYVMITDIDHKYDDVTLPVSKQELIYKKTEIGANCFIGMGARIQAGTILGKGCVVGTNSVVRGVCPDHCVIVGIPGKIIKKYNSDLKTWERV